MRTCVKCGETKSLELFVKNKEKRRKVCKACESRRAVQYYKNNPHKKIRPAYARHRLSQELWQSMLDKYDGKCWSCKTSLATVIDHDHSCCPGTFSCGACVSGVLCVGCNSAAGHLKDSSKRATLLAQYLDR